MLRMELGVRTSTWYTAQSRILKPPIFICNEPAEMDCFCTSKQEVTVTKQSGSKQWQQQQQQLELEGGNIARLMHGTGRGDREGKTKQDTLTDICVKLIQKGL